MNTPGPVVAAAPPPHTGGMVALIPTESDATRLTIGADGEPAEDLHLTLAYLGDDVTGWPDGTRRALTAEIADLTSSHILVEARVFGHAQFNPDGFEDRLPCAVYLIGDAPGLEGLRHQVLGVVAGEGSVPSQREPYVPHITAGYGVDPDRLTYTGPVTFDRVRVALADEVTDLPLGGEAVAAAAAAAEAVTEPADVEIVEDSDALRVRFPVLALEGVDTGDGRFIVPGGLSARSLPVSLLAQPYAAHGGQEPPPAEVVGNITSLTRQPGPEVTSPRTGEPYPDDVFVWSAEGEIDQDHQFADLVRKGYLRGVSVDLSALDAELVDGELGDDGQKPRRKAILRSGEIAAATLVPIPAFGDAYVELAGEDAPPEPVTASALPDGMLTAMVPAWGSSELGDVWALLQRTPSGNVTQEARDKAREAGHALPDGSFPIESGEDLNNAISLAGNAKNPARARRHIIRQAKRLGLTEEIPDTWNGDGTVKGGSQTASAAETLPPISWFRDPELQGPTPLTVTDDGRVYGHLAAWDTEHIGYPGQSITPPRSRADYAYFHTGAVKASGPDDEPVVISAGHISLDTGHASLADDHRTATAHYDHTGTLVADVCAGEDQHGIWVAGALAPGADELSVHKLRSCGLSGDWRRIGSSLELVAAISVPTPGFPVPRARVASGHPAAMVAAGALPRTPGADSGELDYEALAAAIAERIAQRQQQTAELAARRDALLADLDGADWLADRHSSLLDDLDDREERAAALLIELSDTDDDAALVISRMPPQLQRSYLVGKVAQRIQWRTPGDFTRCVAQAKIHGMGRKAKGACATLHRKANGFWPGDRRNR